MDYEGIQEVFLKLKPICAEIATEPKIEKLNELRGVLSSVPTSMLQGFQEYLLFPLAMHLKGNKIKSNEVKQIVVDTMKDIFEFTRTEKCNLFFEVLFTLLTEIYEPKKNNLVADIHEEYKLSIVQCFTAMFKSISWDILTEIYSKEQAPKFSQVTYICLEIAKTEKMRKLRICALECIMAMARISDESDFSDKEIRAQSADIFMLFLPRIASTTGSIVTEDIKIGHKIITIALRTWGRFVTLLMQDYGSPDEEIDFSKLNLLDLRKPAEEKTKKREKKTEWKNKEEFQKFIQASQRTPEWYKNTDSQLKPRIQALSKLQSCPDPNIRNELADVCILILENCIRTMPQSSGKIVEILLVLAEDDYENIQSKSKKALANLSHNFSSFGYKTLLENLQEDFFVYISNLPNVINNSDENKIGSLNLLIGYLRLFGDKQLLTIFHSHLHLQRLMFGLIFISRLNSKTVSVLEEHTTPALELNPHLKSPWKQFAHFHNETATIQNKIHTICSLMSSPEIFDIVSDYLLETFRNVDENRKEATFLLNELASVKPIRNDNLHVIKNIVETYTEQETWNLPLSVSPDSQETLAEVHNNVIQVCLLVEGIGKIAATLEENFQQFMLKCLYLVLERAGSGLPLVQEAGLGALWNISNALRYENVTQLISNNTDYFSFHVTQRLRRIEENPDVLDVLSVVMKYSTMEVLPYISDIVDGVLMQSFDKFQIQNVNSFLRIFQIFVRCLHAWLNIQVDKTIPEKKKDEEFKVSGIDYSNDFSDDIMEGKSAEELYKEDMERKAEGEQENADPDDVEEDAYEKPEPPLHVKLTVSIMKRTLHFLPSKEKTRKLLVISVLKDGFEVIRALEDELLPLVHQTWSPLVDRFKEHDEPLVINLSFQLLITLARLSKYFIRSRTVKDVLPDIVKVLKKLSTSSRLKDKGAMYRYTQAYKLQLQMLSDLALLIVCLEMSEETVKTVLPAVLIYLSDKQPVPLQKAAIDFMRCLQEYDEYKSVISKALEELKDKECDKNVEIVLK